MNIQNVKKIISNKNIKKNSRSFIKFYNNYFQKNSLDSFANKRKLLKSANKTRINLSAAKIRIQKLLNMKFHEKFRKRLNSHNKINNKSYLHLKRNEIYNNLQYTNHMNNNIHSKTLSPPVSFNKIELYDQKINMENQNYFLFSNKNENKKKTNVNNIFRKWKIKKIIKESKRINLKEDNKIDNKIILREDNKFDKENLKDYNKIIINNKEILYKIKTKNKGKNEIIIENKKITINKEKNEIIKEDEIIIINKDKNEIIKESKKTIINKDKNEIYENKLIKIKNENIIENNNEINNKKTTNTNINIIDISNENKKNNNIEFDSFVLSKQIDNNNNIILENEKNKFRFFKGMEFTQKIKTNSPICDKCFRLLYISFDYIKNYISTYCLYCKNILVYKHDKFLEKIKEGNNPILNSYCLNCYKSFIYSDNKCPFYLIEEKDYNFFIICENCIDTSKLKEFKKINFKELIQHNLYLYENNSNDNKLDKLEDLENKSNENDLEIKTHLKSFEDYKNNILLFESIIREAPLSLRKKAEEKLLLLKKEIKIKDILIKYYNEYKNFIIINNICSLFHTIIDFSNLKLSEKTKINKYNDFKQLIECFLNCENYVKFEKLEKPIKFYNYSLLTKNYLNKEENIKDKNEPKELELDLSYLDVLNINFETNETIVYNILALYCNSEKIVPIPYNNYKKETKINCQDILIYNYKNDRKIYYCIYDISFQCTHNPLIPLINEPIRDISKIIMLNNGEDLFIICKIVDNDNLTYFYCISNFRKEKK